MDQTDKYLTFKLGDETYAVSILAVREIIGIVPVTAVPNMPGFVKGIINLRGRVVPVIDLRLRLSMPEKEYTEQTCIVILEHETRLTGLIIDAVAEVVNLEQEKIQECSDLGTHLDSEFIKGIARHNEQVIINLNTAAVLGKDMPAVAA